MERSPAVVFGRLVVSLLVVQILISIITLVGIVARPPPQDCNATIVLDEIIVVQDTDPNSVYGPNATDSWWGNVSLELDGLVLTTPVDFAGDTGYLQVVNSATNGKVGSKSQNINYVFYGWLHERDGPPYGGPMPWDFDASPPASGLLYCPGVYPLSFVAFFIPINNGEAETAGLLQFNYTVTLDP